MHQINHKTEIGSSMNTVDKRIGKFVKDPKVLDGHLKQCGLKDQKIEKGEEEPTFAWDQESQFI